jgi:hypothetical protein
MPNGIREFLNTAAGKAASIAVIVIALGLLGWSIYSNLGSSDIAAISRDRMYVDIKTGQAFPHELKAGDAVPIQAPTGGLTGYPSEACYWTADGKVKKDPSYVVLNETIGKDGPTFCSDCGRLVVGHNPSPIDRHNVAPPTKAEMGQGNRSSRPG